MEAEKKKIRVAIYCRMATDNDSRQGLEMQKERLRQYAQQQGYDIVKEISEVAKGTTLCRPGIRELYGLAHRHAIDKVLAVNIDRFGRNIEDVLRMEGKLKKQHVRLDTPQGNPLPDYRKMVRAFGRRHIM
ncbi:recombinase family protein [Faecalimonas umbilicata]|nr:recombinase family protein [Faecalimonas umbilicata]